MKPLTFKTSKFDLNRFLDALHDFSLKNFGDGDPLPVVDGEEVYQDEIDLIEAFARVEGYETIPDDSRERLEMGLDLFGQFASFDGENGFDCIDGEHVDVPCLDDDDEDYEPEFPRRRRTKKYLQMISNTYCDECTPAYGFLISLGGDTVQIEGKAMRDVSGSCETEMMAQPNLMSDQMRRFVKSFLFRKR